MTHPHAQPLPMKRRSWLQSGALSLLLGQADIAWGATIVAVRVWPAADYTRVTIESDTALKTVPLFVANPPRLAVDIEGIELNPALRELVGKVRSDDPYITGVRVGQYTAGTVRLVASAWSEDWISSISSATRPTKSARGSMFEATLPPSP